MIELLFGEAAESEDPHPDPLSRKVHDLDGEGGPHPNPLGRKVHDGRKIHDLGEGGLFHPKIRYEGKESGQTPSAPTERGEERLRRWSQAFEEWLAERKWSASLE